MAFTILSNRIKTWDMADEQGKFRKVIYPDRGILFDRKGKAILQNTIIYDLMVTPAKLKGVDTRSCKAKLPSRLGENITEILGVRSSDHTPSTL